MIDAIAGEAFRDTLNALKPGWAVTKDGITGPEGALVRLHEVEGSVSAGHVHVQFVLDVSDPRPVEFWDCVTGWGSTESERVQAAAKIWSQTTASAVFEVKYSLHGEFATH